MVNEDSCAAGDPYYCSCRARFFASARRHDRFSLADSCARTIFGLPAQPGHRILYSRLLHASGNNGDALLHDAVGKAVSPHQIIIVIRIIQTFGSIDKWIAHPPFVVQTAERDNHVAGISVVALLIAATVSLPIYRFVYVPQANRKPVFSPKVLSPEEPVQIDIAADASSESNSKTFVPSKVRGTIGVLNRVV